MATTLHILTRPADALAEDIISRQRTKGVQAVEVVDLTASSPDYPALLERVFEADSITVW
jgi:hypothetical protein